MLLYLIGNFNLCVFNAEHNILLYLISMSATDRTCVEDLWTTDHILNFLILANV